MLIASTFVIIGHYFDKRKGTAMGLSSVGCGLGTFAFPPMLTALIHIFRYDFLQNFVNSPWKLVQGKTLICTPFYLFSV